MVISHACFAKADLSSWHLRQQSLRSFCLTFKLRPVSPIYTFPHVQGIRYTPGFKFISVSSLCVYRLLYLITWCSTNFLYKIIQFTMQSLKLHICDLYGKNTHATFKRYERFCNQRARLLNNLTFLKRCRDNKIIPNGLKFKCNFNTVRGCSYEPG